MAKLNFCSAGLFWKPAGCQSKMWTKRKNDRKGLRTLEDAALPRSLQRSAPREVALNASGWVAAVAAVALLLAGIVGGPLVAVFLMEGSARAVELQTSGISTAAQVTDVRRSRDKERKVTIHYRYSAGGQEFTGRKQLRRNDPLAQSAEPGSRVDIVRLPSEPGRSWLRGYEQREEPVWAAAILPAVCLPGAMAIIFLLHRQRRLLADGRVAMARIVSTEKSKHHDSWHVTYTWNLLNGAVRKSHVSRASEPSGSGSFVPLVYDPDQPEHHLLYPLSLVKLR